tara:strand:+ start:17713 stop:19005 length:1293 start_codon:yes stop_codon:yes gene_type:complete
MLNLRAYGLCAILLLGCDTLSVPGGGDSGPVFDGGSDDSDAAIGGPLCGNDEMDPGEACDDGNLVSGDGCSKVCLDENAVCVPAQLGTIFTLGSQAGRMVADAGLLYVAGAPFLNNPRMRILDVSVPGSTAELSGYQHPPKDSPNSRTLGIAKRDDRIWLVGTDPGIVSIDVSAPTAPALDYRRLNPRSDGHLVRLGDNHLLVSQSVAETPVVYDISSGTAAFTTTLGNSGDVYYNVGASGTLAFASTFNNTVDIFGGIDNPGVSTTTVGRYTHPDAWNSSAAVRKIESDGDLMAFAVRGGAAGGIHLVDVGNPSGPVLRATIAEEPDDMMLQGSFLFVPSKDGLRVYDVSNPADPIVAGSIVEFDFNSVSVAIDGALAYMAGEDKLMTIEGLPGLCQPICGNNQREYPEACDDGNRDDGDACNADCSGD